MKKGSQELIKDYIEKGIAHHVVRFDTSKFSQGTALYLCKDGKSLCDTPTQINGADN